MSKSIQITAVADTSTLPAAARRMLDAAVSAFTESANVHVNRTRRIGDLTAAGLSVRGIVAVVTAHTGGAIPSAFSKSSVGRYVQVAAAVRTPGLAELIADPADADADTIKAHRQEAATLIADLYRIAGPGGGADAVTRAAELAAKASSLTDAADAVTGVKGEVTRTAVKEATTDPVRPVAGEAADGGKQITDGEEADADADGEEEAPAADTVGPVGTGAALAAAPLSRLLEELARRVSARGFTPDAVLIAQFDALAADFEAAAASVTEEAAAE